RAGHAAARTAPRRRSSGSTTPTGPGPATADDGPAVAGGGQEPVEDQAHEELPAVPLKVVTAKLAKSTWPGIRPAAVNTLAIACCELITAGLMGTVCDVSSSAALVMMLSGSPVALDQVWAQADWWVSAQAWACAMSLR